MFEQMFTSKPLFCARVSLLPDSLFPDGRKRRKQNRRFRFHLHLPPVTITGNLALRTGNLAPVRHLGGYPPHCHRSSAYSAVVALRSRVPAESPPSRWQYATFPPAITVNPAASSLTSARLRGDRRRSLRDDNKINMTTHIDTKYIF